MKRTTTLLSLAAFGAIGLAAAISMGGPLEPPAGPITSTYKTLTEVEPRIAVNVTNTPGDGNSVFKIRQHGSYYLTGNITGVSSKVGIEIADDNVTLDLNGFQVAGVEGSTDGIRVSEPAARTVCIKNGSVSGWGQNGVNASATAGAVILEVRAWANGANGIYVGQSAIVRHCTTEENDEAGFLTGLNCTLSECTAQASNGLGFSLGNGSVVTGCTAGNNVAEGFNFGTGCTASTCTARLNGTDGFVLRYGVNLSQCTASFNGRDGISAFEAGCGVRNCTAEANTRDGIRVNSDCQLISNLCDSNGYSTGDGAGIHALGMHNRIDSNSCEDADRGIQVEGAHNLIIRNTLGDNGTNFVIAPGNLTGTIVTTEAELNGANTSNVNVVY